MRRVILVLIIGLIFSTPVNAQPISGGQQEQESGRGSSAFSDLLDAIGSGSRLLIKKIQPGEERNRLRNPRFNSQESPRAAYKTFMEAMALVNRGHTDVGYGRALPSLPDDAAPSTADDLYDVLMRIEPVSASELPGKDYIQSSGDTRFVLFPRGTHHKWIWDSVETPPQHDIVLTLDADGSWRFTPETIAAVPDLMESLQDIPPYLEEDQDGQYFLQVFSPCSNKRV